MLAQIQADNERRQQHATAAASAPAPEPTHAREASRIDLSSVTPAQLEGQRRAYEQIQAQNEHARQKEVRRKEKEKDRDKICIIA